RERVHHGAAEARTMSLIPLDRGLTRTDLVVIRGRYDYVERILSWAQIPFTLLSIKGTLNRCQPSISTDPHIAPARSLAVPLSRRANHHRQRRQASARRGEGHSPR